MAAITRHCSLSRFKSAITATTNHAKKNAVTSFSPRPATVGLSNLLAIKKAQVASGKPIMVARFKPSTNCKPNEALPLLRSRMRLAHIMQPEAIITQPAIPPSTYNQRSKGVAKRPVCIELSDS